MTSANLDLPVLRILVLVNVFSQHRAVLDHSVESTTIRDNRAELVDRELVDKQTLWWLETIVLSTRAKDPTLGPFLLGVMGEVLRKLTVVRGSSELKLISTTSLWSLAMEETRNRLPALELLQHQMTKGTSL